MAKGIFTASGSSASNTDITVAAAPGAGDRIYVLWITVTVSVAGTTSRAVITDGVSGSVLGRLSTVTADAMLNINYSTDQKSFSGRPLTENTALVITTSGGAAATINYDVCYMVR
jgi:hypothetical protein